MIAYKKALIIALAVLPASNAAVDQVFTFMKWNGEEQTDMCAWMATPNKEVRIERYCGQHKYTSAEVFAKCPATCSTLSTRPNADPCSDLPETYTFTGENSGKAYNCAWLTKSKKESTNQKRKDLYCTAEEQLTACAETCGVCTSVITTPAPTSAPTSASTTSPTGTTPTATPSRPPSPMPSPFPTLRPTSQPSDAPSMVPSDVPSDVPSMVPSDEPSMLPSMVPSDSPSTVPSDVPSDSPSTVPSDEPSMVPSVTPSDQPSSLPSKEPSRSPSSEPSDQPSLLPSKEPSRSPSSNPTSSIKPSPIPTAAPFAPTFTPSTFPTTFPTNAPSQVPTSSCHDDKEYEFNRTPDSIVAIMVDCTYMCKNKDNEITKKRQDKWCTGEVLEKCCASCSAGGKCS